MDYLDFDIEVAPGKRGDYDVSVVQSPAGEAHAKMSFPYDKLALQNRIQSLQIALLRSASSRRAGANADDKSVEALGTDLFAALFSGEISSRLDVSRTIAKREGKGVRIKLRFSEPELAGLPWEYLYDPELGDYLALGTSTPVVRYIPVAQPIMPLEVSPPLRILAMTAGPSDLGELDAARERQRLDTALGRLTERGLVEVHWVDGEKWEDLQEALWNGPWHIFHFVGHGGFSERRNSGVIYLTGDDGKARELSARDLAVLLGDHEPLRLALLNSCETAQGAKTDIFSSTAAALVRRGTPAVVAMQFEITDEAAIQFSRSFYAAIAHGMPVDAAVAEARKSVALQVANTYEWGTPVLFMRSVDGQLFKIPPIVDEPTTDTEKAATAAGVAGAAGTLSGDTTPTETVPKAAVPVAQPSAGWEDTLRTNRGAVAAIGAVIGLVLLGVLALALIGLPPTPTASPDPSVIASASSGASDGPPTPTPFPFPNADITLDPDHAPPGGFTIVRGVAFPPGEIVTVRYALRPTGPTTKVRQDGTFLLRFDVALDIDPGPKNLRAEATGALAKDHFTVDQPLPTPIATPGPLPLPDAP